MPPLPLITPWPRPFRKLPSLARLGCCLLAVAMGCNTTPDDAPTVIADSLGLQLSLSWHLGPGSTDQQAVDAIDLDLELWAADTLYAKSNSAFNFEQLALADSVPNGNYTVQLFFFEGQQDHGYTLTVEGLNPGADGYNFFGSLEERQLAEHVALVSITKQNNQYVLVDLLKAEN